MTDFNQDLAECDDKYITKNLSKHWSIKIKLVIISFIRLTHPKQDIFFRYIKIWYYQHLNQSFIKSAYNSYEYILLMVFFENIKLKIFKIESKLLYKFMVQRPFF